MTMGLIHAVTLSMSLSAPASSSGRPVAALTTQPTTMGTQATKAATPKCETALKLSKKHKALQKALEKRLSETRLSKYTRKHRLGVALVDITNAGELYYAGVNDDEMMYAASLPKIAIMLAVAQAAEDGEVTWTSEFDRRLGAMVTESSNTDASWGVEQVGLTAIGETMRDPRYCFYDESKGGGLWVGKPYGPSAFENREPLQNLSHAASARQAARFMTMLSREQLVSKDWSQHMLKIMGPPKHHHKFVGGLQGRDDVQFLARKSGSWRNWHADSALIQHGDSRYVAIGISELKNGEAVMQELIKVLDDLVVEGKHRKSRPRRS